MIDLGMVIKDLRRPFTSQAVGFKIQTNPKESKALIVTYMDSRLAAERLNAVCPGDWHDRFEPPISLDGAGRGVVCNLTVCGATRCDVGYEQNPDTDMGLKGLYSDAFKRAAVKFGIGAYLYALPKSYLDASDLKMVQGRRGPSWYIKRDGKRKLLHQYAEWLKLPQTIERFGQPLDHGDHEDAQGEPLAAPSVVDEVVAEAKAAAEAGVKLGPLFHQLDVQPLGSVTETLRSMSPGAVEQFRSLLVVDEAKQKLNAEEVKS